MRLRTLPALLIILALSFLAIFRPARAQGVSSVTMTVRAGFDGYHKDGTWFPVQVILENKGPDISATVHIRFIGINPSLPVYAYPVYLASGAHKQLTVSVFSQGYYQYMEVSLLSKKNVVALVRPTLKSLSSSDLLFGVIAGNPSGFNVLSKMNTSGNSSIVAVLNLAELPERAEVLNSLDGLVFSNVDTGTLTPVQGAVLDAWIRAGGRLILTGGTDWTQVRAGLKSFEWLPVGDAPATSLIQDLTSVQAYANSQAPLSIPKQAAGILAAIGNLAPNAEILLKAPILQTGPVDRTVDLPVAINMNVGYGQVIYLAFDPSQPPFTNWDGIEGLYSHLLASPPVRPAWSGGIRSWSDAREAAMTLRDLMLPAWWIVCGFLIVYLLVVGPVNYLLLSFISKVTRRQRREWGWITIPVFVIGFSLLVFTGGILTRGNKPIQNRMAVVQVWPGQAQAMINGVIGLYSPGRTTYRLDAPPGFLLHSLRTDQDPAPATETIQQDGERMSALSLPVDIGGVFPLAFDGTISAPQFGGEAVLRLDDQGISISGSITNQSDLRLKDVALLTPGGVITMTEFLPGASLPFNKPITRAQPFGNGGSKGYPFLSPSYISPVGSAPIYTMPYGYYADNTIYDILGTGNFYQDRQLHRRFLILNSFINYYANQGSRGVNVFLAGWSNQIPVDTSVKGSVSKIQDEVVYLVAFQPRIEQINSNELVLTPGAFGWTVIENSGSSSTPYGVYIYSPIAYALEFIPSLPLQVSLGQTHTIKALTLHLASSSGSGVVSGITFQLWDFQTNKWVDLQNITSTEDAQWGTNEILQPDRFVGSNGAIRLRVQGDTASGIQIDASDFTLILEKRP